jgi:hypothetical protein
MVRDLEAVLAMATRAGPPALIVNARLFRKKLDSRRKPEELPPEELPFVQQLWLWIERPGGQLEVWRGRLSLGESVCCDHFDAPITPLKTCLERQGATWPGGNRYKDGKVRAKKAGIHPYCSSGKCDQGKCYALSVKGEWIMERFKFYRDDTPAQRKAMKEFKQSHTDFVPMIDAPKGVGETIKLREGDEIEIGEPFDATALASNLQE